MSQFYDQASLVMVPSGYKAGKVYSQKPLSTDGELTFTRNSNATRVNADGLVEKVRTNLIKYSNDFSNAVYLKSNTTVTAGQSDPNGGTNASKIVFASGFNSFLYQIVGAGTKTNSVWLRADSPVEIGFHNGQSSNAVTLTTSWVRYSVTQLGTSSAGFQLDNYFGVSTPQLAVTFYAYQAQNEESDFGPTDYIPTTTSARSTFAGITVDGTSVPNVPRLDYSGGATCGKLLLEPQRTNIAYPSETMTGYAKSSAITLTGGAAISPQGYQNATYYFCNTATTNGYLLPSFSGTSGIQYAVSFYAKAKELTRIYIKNVNDSGSQSWFELSNGTYNHLSGIDSMSIESVGNGWYRCIAVSTSSSTGIKWVPIIKGNANEGVYIWGLQIEAGSYATSYIPTGGSGASVTRLADAAYKTGISSLIGQTEGTLFVDFEFVGYDYNAQWIAFLVGAAGNYIGFYTDGSSKIIAEVAVSVAQFLDASRSVVVGTRYKMALAYKANDFAYYVNGSQIQLDTIGSVPACSTFTFNYNSSAANQSASKYNQTLLFPTRLTNAQLAELTTL